MNVTFYIASHYKQEELLLCFLVDSRQNKPFSKRRQTLKRHVAVYPIAPHTNIQRLLAITFYLSTFIMLFETLHQIEAVYTSLLLRTEDKIAEKTKVRCAYQHAGGSKQ